MTVEEKIKQELNCLCREYYKAWAEFKQLSPRLASIKDEDEAKQLSIRIDFLKHKVIGIVFAERALKPLLKAPYEVPDKFITKWKEGVFNPSGDEKFKSWTCDAAVEQLKLDAPEEYDS